MLWSTKHPKIILVCLTFPWDEGCDETHKRKAYKYESLVQEFRDKGWQVWLFPMEIGCRDFPTKYSFCCQLWTNGARWERRQKVTCVGNGVSERRKAGGVEQMGSVWATKL